MTIRKKFRTTISFLRRPKYAFVDPFWVSPKIGLIWWSVWGHFLKRFCGNNDLMAYRTMDRPTFGDRLRLGVLFIFTRRRNRADSMQLLAILAWEMILLRARKAWRFARDYVPQFHVKVARKNGALGRATSWNFFGFLEETWFAWSSYRPICVVKKTQTS